MTYLKLDLDVPGRVTVTVRSCLRDGHGHGHGEIRYGTLRPRYSHLNGRFTVNDEVDKN